MALILPCPLSPHYNVAGLKPLDTNGCSARKEAGKVTVSDRKAAFQMTPQSIITFSGKVGKP
jgi:hypothetical protein